MNIKSNFTLLPVALTLGMASTNVYSDEVNTHKPYFSGNLTAGVLDVEGRDADPWAFKAEAGLGGIYKVNDDLRIRYDVVADLANAINNADENRWTPGQYYMDEGEVYIRTARVLLLTDYGVLGFQPRVPSGFWRQIYGNVDTFEYNRFHGQTGKNSFFGQNEQTRNVFSYGSPKFGGFQLIAALINPNDKVDVSSARIVYKKDTLNVALGYTQVNRTGIDDLQRTSFGLGYSLGMVDIGGVYEHNEDKESKDRVSDFDAWAVNLSAQFNESWSGSVAYAKNNKNNNLDNSGVTAIFRHHFNSKVYAFLEGATYDRTLDNVLGGISVSF